MDSFKRVRDNSVILQGNDIESLKTEISGWLTQAITRRPKDVTLQSFKIPMGFSAIVPPGESIKSVLAFPIAGTLQDFMSYVPLGAKEIFVQITSVDSVGSQRAETRLLDGFRSYTIKAECAKTSYVTIKITNNTKADADCVFGFTFQEVRSDEIKKTKLDGNFESRSIA